MNKHVIFGVHITDRIKRVSEVQQLLSEYGCYIKTRLGLHETSKDSCSPNGLVILEMLDTSTEVEDLFTKLSRVEGVEVQRMIFDH
jgi:hypothetical protein